MIDHTRRFPQCVYVKQLRGIAIYRQIHESNRAQQGHADVSNATLFTDDGQLLIVNENNIPRLVADRLNWLMSQTLLNRSYSLSIITQCWEDQLRLKGEDFVTDLDLEMACLIRQTINDYINSANENIIIPSESMRQLREREMKAQAEELARIREAQGLPPRDIIPSSSTNVYENHNETTTATESTADHTKTKSQLDESTPSNPCVLCLTDEKRLACIPCGHLATCVPCGHALRSCPICRREIEAFVRIYR